MSCVARPSSRRSELCVAAITLFLLASNTVLHAQMYGITDLGTLPGTGKSVAYGLNHLGQAVGVSSNPTGAIATLFSNGRTTNMNTLGADVSVATSIGGSGQAAGYNIFDSNPAPIFRAFLYGNGSMTDIQSDTLFPSGTIAYGINSAGEAVGEGMLTSWTFRPFLYSNGRMVDLGTLGGSQAGASAINDSGEIVGSSLPAKGNGHAFLYSNGKMADLGVPSGAYSSDAKAINGIGQIVGTLYFSSQSSHAALYSNGVWTDLEAFLGASGTSATGINTAGQIVGTAVFPVKSYHPFRLGMHVGFIYRGGVLVDLNGLIPSNSRVHHNGCRRNQRFRPDPLHCDKCQRFRACRPADS
jgi:probable HAF family extracellular repeat protein